MKKIIVIGCPGSGKSVFSKKLKEVTKLPLYHLDMIYHKSDGTQISKEELREKVKELIKREEWIIDGNYQRTLELRLQACDTVFLLDYPLKVCLEGASSRIGVKRDDLPWIEEQLDPNFKQSIIDFSKEKTPKIYELLEQYKNKREIIIFKTRDESDEYLKKITKGGDDYEDKKV